MSSQDLKLTGDLSAGSTVGWQWRRLVENVDGCMVDKSLRLAKKTESHW